jgi:hypothetical protein
VLHGLKQGNEILKEIHKELNVESVEKLLGETAEAREYQRVTLFPFYARIAFLRALALGNRQYAYEQPFLGRGRGGSDRVDVTTTRNSELPMLSLLIH